MKKVTRRQLMGAAAASALAAKVVAQAPASNQAPDFAQAAQESHRKNSDDPGQLSDSDVR